MLDWIVKLVGDMGYVGIAFLMFLENVIPPIPSEMIMPLAGFAVAKGQMELLPAILSGIVGSIAGSIPWYYVGWVCTKEKTLNLSDRFGRWIGIGSEEVSKSYKWFDRHGLNAVLFGRVVPAVRTLISVPAGLARMKLPIFLFYSTLGTAAWVTMLTLAGYQLGDHYRLVEHYIDPLSKVVVLGIGGFIIVRAVHKKLTKK